MQITKGEIEVTQTVPSITVTLPVEDWKNLSYLFHTGMTWNNDGNDIHRRFSHEEIMVAARMYDALEEAGGTR